MKKLQLLILVPLVLLLIVGIAYGVATLSREALPTTSSRTVTCDATGTNYTVTITDGIPSPTNIHAHACDTLTIVNADDQLRLMAFGVHERHQAYGGITEETLKPGEQMTVTLEELGTFTFHDHLHEEVKGTFTVN